MRFARFRRFRRFRVALEVKIWEAHNGIVSDDASQSIGDMMRWAWFRS